MGRAGKNLDTLGVRKQTVHPATNMIGRIPLVGDYKSLRWHRRIFVPGFNFVVARIGIGAVALNHRGHALALIVQVHNQRHANLAHIRHT